MPPAASAAIGSPAPAWGERRLVSVVVVRPKRGVGAASALERARRGAAPFGARVELRPDGTIVAVLSGAGGARDRAAQAARCALALRDAVAGGPVALATEPVEPGHAG